MIKKYLILIVGLFFVTTSVFAAARGADTPNGSDRAVSTGNTNSDVNGESVKSSCKKGNVTEMMSCLSVELKDDIGTLSSKKTLLFEDKDNKLYAIDLALANGNVVPKDPYFYKVYYIKKKSDTEGTYNDEIRVVNSSDIKNREKQVIGIADSKGDIKVFTDNQGKVYPVTEKINITDIGANVLGAGGKDLIKEMNKVGVPVYNSDGDELIGRDSPELKDTDGDGVTDEKDEDPYNSNNANSITPSSNPYTPRWINDNHCDSISDCNLRYSCRKDYYLLHEKAKNNIGSGMLSKMSNPTRMVDSNKERISCNNKKNAIQEAQENKTELVTQVMNLKEYCESKKSDRGKGLVQYDGVCDKYWGEKGGATTALFEMMDRILVWIRNIIIVIGSALLFWGGVLYIKSATDPNEKKKAKDLMMRVAIGLIFVLFAFAIVQLILDTFADGGVKGDYSGLSTEVKNK